MMMKKSLALSVLLLFSFTAWCQDLLINTFNRDVFSLNGSWHYIVDPYESGYLDYRLKPYDQMPNVPVAAYFMDHKATDKRELVEYDFDLAPVIEVPGDWNSQKQELLYYEGTVWYRKRFDYRMKDPSHRLFLYFGAVNYLADVYLNGKKLGTHEGGFTPFQFEVTGLVRDTGNSLVVRVDNTRHPDAVPTVNTDWWNYGGITRDVKLIEEPTVSIVDYSLGLDPQNASMLKGWVRLNGAREGEKLNLEIPELGIQKTMAVDTAGQARFEVRARNLQYWSPASPKLYEVFLKSSYQTLRDEIGFRTIGTRGTRILLNGQPVFLRGISIHEENPLRGGRACTEADALVLLNWARELGCNFVRLAHYPHNEYMLKLADRMGIMVWEEIPVYWTINFGNEQVLEKAKSQLSEVIHRDRNRAAAIIWSVANETPVSAERNAFLSKLVEHVRSLDPDRLVSAALQSHGEPGVRNLSIVDDPIGAAFDIVSFNQYTGWYSETPEEAPGHQWIVKYDKPVVISEFGGGALQGLHGLPSERWTEEYQAFLYEQNIRMLEKIPQLAGMTPWILADFRSPRRNLAVIQDGYNRKGLVSSNGIKKQAFFVLRKYYLEKQQEILK